MLEQTWDRFVIYVNAYYAIQETYDSARREWERPAFGLDVFCRDANPFLWDEQGSAEESIYEGFAAAFDDRFESKECTAAEGLDFVRTWLSTLEGPVYGTDLVSSLEQTADEKAWEKACRPISRQLSSRAAHLERTPQEEPLPFEPPAPKEPSKADVEAVIELLAKGDEAFAEQLRQRLREGDEA